MLRISLRARRLTAATALLLSVAAPALPAQTPSVAPPVSAVVDTSLAAIDSLLSALYPAGEPGAAVLVARDGQVLMRRAYGAASVELGVPLRPEHVFRIGSITKQFTAVAILMLVEEGRISLDDEITRFFPDYPTQGRRITVEHLLTHTSGIRSYTAMPEYRARMRQDLPRDSLLAGFREQPMDFAPGEDWRYNNSGYALLGAIIERVTGIPYAEFLRTRIYSQLGMRNTGYETRDAVIPGRVDGYQREDDGVRPADYVSMSLPYAAGALVSTVDDLLLWQQAVAQGRLLSPDTWRRAFQEFRLADGRGSGYGFGWFLGTVAGQPSIEHGGDINGFSSNGLWIPSARLHVVVLANHEREAERNPEVISGQIAARLVRSPALPPGIAVTPQELDAYTGVYRTGGQERRVVFREGGRLYSQRGRQPRSEIVPVGRDEFVYASGARARFVRDAGGRVTGMLVRQRLGPEDLAPRTEESVEATLTALNAVVEVPAALLAQYAGDYELEPGAVIQIRVEGTRLTARPPGGDEAAPLVTLSETRFQVEGDDAVLEFERDAAGNVTRLVLREGDRAMPARRL